MGDLEAIPGSVPNLLELDEGCLFENRCVKEYNLMKMKITLTKMKL